MNATIEYDQQQSLEAMASLIESTLGYRADPVHENDEVQVHTRSSSVVWAVQPVYRTGEWAIQSVLLDRYGEGVDFRQFGNWPASEVVGALDNLITGGTW